jgi:hypothetical protein
VGSAEVVPSGSQYVVTAVIFTVPFGVTLQFCVALPPAAVVAVTVKAFATRDSACVGVHVVVFPEIVAPAGPVVSANVIALPSATVAITV